MRVDAAGGRPRDQRIPLEQAEGSGRLDGAIGERFRRGEHVQVIAVRDAVEVDDPDDVSELTTDLRLVDVEPRTCELDLLRRKRDEPHSDLQGAAGESGCDAAHTLDAG